jgi:hypothetical protein
MAGCYERGNKVWGSLKCREFIDYLRECQPVNSGSASLK